MNEGERRIGQEGHSRRGKKEKESSEENIDRVHRSQTKCQNEDTSLFPLLLKGEQQP